MKKLLVLGVLSTLFLAGCSQSKEEKQEKMNVSTEKITVKSKRNTDIYATTVVPDTKEDMPLVVMAHGFVGDREGCANFEPLANKLAENGIASIRIDFPGNGESKEDYTAYDLTNMTDDLDSAIAFMKDKYSIQKIGMVGHSMGGRITSLYIDDKIDVAVLWAPAANDGLSGLYDFMGGEKAVKEMYNEAKKNGKSTFTLWGEPYVDCSLQFFEENEKSKPLENIAKYKGKLMIAVDEVDDYVSKTTTNAVIQAATDIQVLNVKNADHVFDAADGSGSQEPRQLLVERTYEFLNNNLK